MAETSSLLNCRTGSRTGGSNPPASALKKNIEEPMVDWLTAYLQCDSVIQVNLMTLAARSIHLMVRIQDSQSWHRGSIPLSTTKGFFQGKKIFKVIQVNLMTLATWSIHLMVRIQDSQSWHRGSIPLSTTKKASHFREAFFAFPTSINSQVAIKKKNKKNS